MVGNIDFDFKHWKAALPIVFIAIVLIWAYATRTSAVDLEQQILGAKRIIDINYSTRNSQVKQMVAVVERGAAQEKAIHTAYANARAGVKEALAEARELSDNGDYQSALDKLNIVVEAVPELKSIEGYNNLEKTIGMCENNIKDAQVNHTNLVSQYRSLVQAPISRALLRVTFYSVNQECMTYLQFSEDVATPPSFDFEPLD